MNSFQLNILAADRPFYEGSCTSLTIPTPEGRYGIMARHYNMVLAISPGLLTFDTPGKGSRDASVSHGLVIVEDNEVLILVDSAERPQEIDANRARQAAQAARREMLHKGSLREHQIAQARLARAIARLKVKGDYDRENGLGNP
ncbi:MAG: ATP synthase F1 subunit epsilon [Christensenellales bacterium]|jgi:F-type H+-transporting ATPase subunit epsilon